MLKSLWTLPLAALAVAAPALAQGEPVPPGSAPTTPSTAPSTLPSSPFSQLWTPWAGVTRESSEAEERRSRLEAQAEAPSAVPATATQALARRPGHGPALGERVGEIVRTGDCEGGERIAREAGDFALVQAVRDHCRPRRPNP